MTNDWRAPRVGVLVRPGVFDDGSPWILDLRYRGDESRRSTRTASLSPPRG